MPTTPGGIWYPDGDTPVTSLQALFSTMASSIDTYNAGAKTRILFNGFGGSGTSASVTPVTMLSTGVLPITSSRIIQVTASFNATATAPCGVRGSVTGIPGALVSAPYLADWYTGAFLTLSRTFIYTATADISLTLVLLRDGGTGTISANNALLTVLDLGSAV